MHSAYASHITTLENTAAPRDRTRTPAYGSSYSLQFGVQLLPSEDKLWRLRLSKDNIYVFRKLQACLPRWHCPLLVTQTEYKKRQFSSAQIRGIGHNSIKSVAPSEMTMNIASTENATGLDCNIFVNFILTRIVLRECVKLHVNNMAGICCRSLSHYTANFIFCGIFSCHSDEFQVTVWAVTPCKARLRH